MALPEMTPARVQIEVDASKCTIPMTCKHACLTASETVYKDLDLKASVGMDASMAEDGYCQFATKNLEI